MARFAAFAVAAAAAVAACWTSGCASTPTEGYAATTPYPTKYRSVALSVFRNQSYMRGFEQDLLRLSDAIAVRYFPHRAPAHAASDEPV
jgi:hypothetical protein